MVIIVSAIADGIYDICSVSVYLFLQLRIVVCVGLRCSLTSYPRFFFLYINGIVENNANSCLWKRTMRRLRETFEGHAVKAIGNYSNILHQNIVCYWKYLLLAISNGCFEAFMISSRIFGLCPVPSIVGGDLLGVCKFRLSSGRCLCILNVLVDPYAICYHFSLLYINYQSSLRFRVGIR